MLHHISIQEVPVQVPANWQRQTATHSTQRLPNCSPPIPVWVEAVQQGIKRLPACVKDQLGSFSLPMTNSWYGTSRPAVTLAGTSRVSSSEPAAKGAFGRVVRLAALDRGLQPAARQSAHRRGLRRIVAQNLLEKGR